MHTPLAKSSAAKKQDCGWRQNWGECTMNELKRAHRQLRVIPQKGRRPGAEGWRQRLHLSPWAGGRASVGAAQLGQLALSSTADR